MSGFFTTEWLYNQPTILLKILKIKGIPTAFRFLFGEYRLSWSDCSFPTRKKKLFIWLFIKTKDSSDVFLSFARCYNDQKYKSKYLTNSLYALVFAIWVYMRFIIIRVYLFYISNNSGS